MTNLPVDPKLSIGFITGAASPAAARATAELADRLGYDSLWVGDHIAFAIPILDPLLQLAQLAVFSERLTLGRRCICCRCAIRSRPPSRSPAWTRCAQGA